MALQQWVVDIEQQRDNTIRRNPPSIYKVPEDIVEGQDQKSSVFSPYKISIGPFHHGIPSCQLGERHKEQCLLTLLKSQDKKKPFQKYVDALTSIEDELKDAYDPLDFDRLDEDKKKSFLKMMIIDGCFLLEIMLANLLYGIRVKPDNKESHLREMDIYRHDMLLFDNQIPLQVLVALYSVHLSDRHAKFPKSKSDEDSRKWVKLLILDFFSLSPFDAGQSKNLQTIDFDSKNLHILDVYREGLLRHKLFPTRYPEAGDENFKDSCSVTNFSIPSATRTHKSRIGITKCGENEKISCENETLKLPPVDLDNTTKSIFHNLILLERYNFYPCRLFSSYAYFMTGLLNGAGDASLLREHGIIRTTSLHDAEVVELFHGLCKHNVLNAGQPMDSQLFKVGEQLRQRHEKNRKKWWLLDLIQNYLNSPWKIFGLIFAFLIFGLTATQTIYNVLDYYHSRCVRSCV